MSDWARGVGELEEDVIGREWIGWKRQLSAAVRRECSDLANMIVVDVVINGNVDRKAEMALTSLRCR